MKNRSGPAALVTGVGDGPLESLLGEVIALFHRLSHETERIHGQGAASAGRRGVLRGLRQLGPQTVPQMARARPVSRQYMQTLVNALERDGLVELVENPAHKRSSLVRLTPRGEKLAARMDRRERQVFRNLQGLLPARKLRDAAGVLRDVRRLLEKEKWRRPG